jgi:hypothetical protein
VTAEARARAADFRQGARPRVRPFSKTRPTAARCRGGACPDREARSVRRQRGTRTRSRTSPDAHDQKPRRGRPGDSGRSSPPPEGRGGQLRLLAACHHEPGVPSRRTPCCRGLDRLGVHPAARDQPGDHRVRVPHVTGLEVIAAPHGRWYLRDEIEHPLCASSFVGQTPRAVNGLVDVGDSSVAPAPYLVAEDPKPARHGLRAPSGTGRTQVAAQPAPLPPRTPGR